MRIFNVISWVEKAAVCSILFAPSFSLADPIYVRQLPNGKTVFTTEAPTTKATPIALPTIVRGEKKVATVNTCRGHGGILCSAGADTDGSVVCFDGFRDSVQDFGNSCSNVSLSVSEISLDTASGDALLFIRNRSAKEAKEVILTYEPRLGRTQKHNIPDIPPFEEIQFRLPKDRIGEGDKLPAEGEVSLSCSACSSIEKEFNP